MTIEVIKAYTAQYPDPISFEVGVAVQVGRGDPEKWTCFDPDSLNNRRS